MSNMVENTSNLQLNIVSLRTKYIPTISRYDEQNSKIELKLLEKKEFKINHVNVIPDINLKKNNISKDATILLDKKKISSIKNKLKDFEKVTACLIHNKKCDIYKELQ